MKILKNTSKELQEYLLNPKQGNHYKCFLWTREGFRFVEVKVARKWVSLKWTKSRQRLTLALWKNHAWLQWRYNARNDACIKAFEETGSYKRPNSWYKAYGFKTNPEHESVNKTAWRC